jgi:hypothetical protein
MPDIYLRAGAATPTDVRLYDPTTADAPPAPSAPPLRTMMGMGR